MEILKEKSETAFSMDKIEKRQRDRTEMKNTLKAMRPKLKWAEIEERLEAAYPYYSEELDDKITRCCEDSLVLRQARHAREQGKTEATIILH